MANYSKYMYEVFGNRIIDDFRELVEDILDRIDFEDFVNVNEDNYEKLMEEIDSSNFIYNDYQWAMMMQYQNPQDANFDEAYNLFLDDMITIVENIVNDMVDEDLLVNEKY